MENILIPPHGKIGSDERAGSERVFCARLFELQDMIRKKASARGWCYLLEPEGLSKSMFDITEKAINDCRKSGSLPVDFTAEEEGRRFSGIEIPDTRDPEDEIKGYLAMSLECQEFYTPDWWDGEKYYIQMVVEKIDLKVLFEDICKEYHIPIATSKGWSSISLRAEYAARFKEAEADGLVPVLLTAGDHDPSGLFITSKYRKNLNDLKNIRWEDGRTGYDPENLVIDRFGLNFDFIQENHLTWIDDTHISPVGVPKLLTGSGKDLNDPHHKDHNKPYVKDYIQRYGVRKCEANALQRVPDKAEALCRSAIEKYLGSNSLDRFARKRGVIRERFSKARKTFSCDGVSLEEMVNKFIVNEGE